MNKANRTDSELAAILSCLVDNSANGVVVLDQDYHVIIWNQWMVQHSKITTQKLLNQSLFALLPNLTNGRLKSAIDDTLFKGMSSFLSQTLSKSPFPLSDPHRPSKKIKQTISIKPLDTSTGNRFCYIHINDVTPAVNREYFLRELAANAQIAQQSAEEIAELKSNFISTVSHELRTPMTSVLGSLGLVKGLMADDLPENLRGLINIAHQNTERLLSLINDILDIEKISSSGIELNYETFDLMLFLNEAINANAGYAERQNISFIINEFSQTTLLRADFAKLQQVMNNLLSNAAKHEPENGRVEVSLQQSANSIRINVKDHGPGIPLDFQDKIFEKFSQADSSNTRNIRGTGLGLAIAKAIIDIHGGQIGFFSIPGEGAEFYIELPIHTEDKPDT